MKLEVAIFLLCSVAIVFSQGASESEGQKTVTPEKDTQTEQDPKDPDASGAESQKTEKVVPLCPAWECKDLNETEAGYCFFRKDDKSNVTANNNYDNKTVGCFVSSMFNQTQAEIDGKNAGLKAVSEVQENADLGPETVKKQVFGVCTEALITKLKTDLKCDAFCEAQTEKTETTTTTGHIYTKQETKKTCNYTAYQEAELKTVKTKGTAKGWELCNANDECASNSCRCVPATDNNNAGRCTAGLQDKINEDLWNSVCTEEKKNDTCALYLQNEHGHLLGALNLLEKNNELTCLQKLADYNVFPTVQLAVKTDDKGAGAGEEEGSSVLLIIIIIILVVVVVGVIIYCMKRGKDNNDYQQVNDGPGGTGPNDNNVVKQNA